MKEKLGSLGSRRSGGARQSVMARGEAPDGCLQSIPDRGREMSRRESAGDEPGAASRAASEGRANYCIIRRIGAERHRARERTGSSMRRARCAPHFFPSWLVRRLMVSTQLPSTLVLRCSDCCRLIEHESSVSWKFRAPTAVYLTVKIRQYTTRGNYGEVPRLMQ